MGASGFEIDTASNLVPVLGLRLLSESPRAHQGLLSLARYPQSFVVELCLRKLSVDQMHLMDILRAFHPKAAEYTFFSTAYETFSWINCMLDVPLSQFFMLVGYLRVFLFLFLQLNLAGTHVGKSTVEVGLMREVKECTGLLLGRAVWLYMRLPLPINHPMNGCLQTRWCAANPVA